MSSIFLWISSTWSRLLAGSDEIGVGAGPLSVDVAVRVFFVLVVESDLFASLLLGGLFICGDGGGGGSSGIVVLVDVVGEQRRRSGRNTGTNFGF